MRREEQKEAEEDEDAHLSLLFHHQPPAQPNHRRRQRSSSPSRASSAAAAGPCDADGRWGWLFSVPGPIRRLAWRERSSAVGVAGGGRGGRGGGGGGGGAGEAGGVRGGRGGGGVGRSAAAAVWPVASTVVGAVDLTGDERVEEWERMAECMAQPLSSSPFLSLSSLLSMDAAAVPDSVDDLLLRVDGLSPHHPSPNVSPALEAAMGLLDSIAQHRPPHAVDAGRDGLRSPPSSAPPRPPPHPLLPPLRVLASSSSSSPLSSPRWPLGASHYLHAQLSDHQLTITASIDAALCTPPPSYHAPQPHHSSSSSASSLLWLHVGCFIHLRGVRVVQSSYRQPHLLIRAGNVISARPPPLPAHLASPLSAPPRSIDVDDRGRSASTAAAAGEAEGERVRGEGSAAHAASPAAAPAPAVSSAVSIDWSSTEEAVLQALEAAM